MVSRRPGPGELLAGASGLLLLIAMFVPWFGLDGRARVPGSGQVISVTGDNVNAWQAFGAIDLVLALAALLAIAVFAFSLVSTPPPALAVAATAAAALAALLIVYRLIDVPDIPVEDAGDTAYETGRRLGAFFGLLCTAGIAWGANLVAGAASASRAAPEARAFDRARARAFSHPRAGSARPGARLPRAGHACPHALFHPPSIATGPLGGWSRAAIDADCQTAWRRHDRRLGARYARYFEEHPELAGEQRTSARDLPAALPPGWEALAEAIPRTAGSASTCPASPARRSGWACWGWRPVATPRWRGCGTRWRRCRRPPIRGWSSSTSWTPTCSASAHARPASTCSSTTRRC